MLIRSLAVFAGAVALGAGPAAAQTIDLHGLDGPPKTITAAQLDALPQVEVHVKARGVDRVYTGPRLIDLLGLTAASAGKSPTARDLAVAVLVTSADGSAVAFGLAELDPSVDPNTVILADLADGALMPAQEGPFRLVVDGDLSSARAVRSVRRIDILRLKSKP